MSMLFLPKKKKSNTSNKVKVPLNIQLHSPQRGNCYPNLYIFADQVLCINMYHIKIHNLVVWTFRNIVASWVFISLRSIFRWALGNFFFL